ncbi:hypothetical protein FB451DRAFT_1419749 [Mycena latifolia]|nr:hypothetical protein FB451DRAFT_1419749 [Mycena latifolia]
MGLDLNMKVSAMIMPPWKRWDIEHTKMLFNKTEDGIPVVKPFETSDDDLLVRCHEIADDHAKRERWNTNTTNDCPQKHNKRDENAAPPPFGPSSSSATPNAGGGKHCLKLTEDERELLITNHGCTRCCVEDNDIGVLISSNKGEATCHCEYDQQAQPKCQQNTLWDSGSHGGIA